MAVEELAEVEAEGFELFVDLVLIFDSLNLIVDNFHSKACRSQKQLCPRSLNLHPLSGVLEEVSAHLSFQRICQQQRSESSLQPSQRPFREPSQRPSSPIQRPFPSRSQRPSSRPFSQRSSQSERLLRLLLKELR